LYLVAHVNFLLNEYDYDDDDDDDDDHPTMSSNRRRRRRDGSEGRGVKGKYIP